MRGLLARWAGGAGCVRGGSVGLGAARGFCARWRPLRGRGGGAMPLSAPPPGKMQRLGSRRWPREGRRGAGGPARPARAGNAQHLLVPGYLGGGGRLVKSVAAAAAGLPRLCRGSHPPNTAEAGAAVDRVWRSAGWRLDGVEGRESRGAARQRPEPSGPGGRGAPGAVK